MYFVKVEMKITIWCIVLKKFINKDIYKNVIRELTGVTYYYKRNINLTFKNFQEKVNKYNNYFIFIDQTKINLIDIYYYYYYYKFNDNLLIQLSGITFFKELIETIIKYLTYSFVLKKYKVYSRNNVENKEEINENINLLLLNYKYIQKLTNISYQ